LVRHFNALHFIYNLLPDAVGGADKALVGKNAVASHDEQDDGYDGQRGGELGAERHLLHAYHPANDGIGDCPRKAERDVEHTQTCLTLPVLIGKDGDEDEGRGDDEQREQGPYDGRRRSVAHDKQVEHLQGRAHRARLKAPYLQTQTHRDGNESEQQIDGLLALYHLVCGLVEWIDFLRGVTEIDVALDKFFGGEERGFGKLLVVTRNLNLLAILEDFFE